MGVSLPGSVRMMGTLRQRFNVFELLLLLLTVLGGSSVSIGTVVACVATVVVVVAASLGVPLG